MHLAGDQVDQLVVGRWRVGEHAGAGNVHVGDAILKVEELGIQGFEVVHHNSFHGLGPAADGRGRCTDGRTTVIGRPLEEKVTAASREGSADR